MTPTTKGNTMSVLYHGGAPDLQPGDSIAIEIEGIGTLSNPVV